MTHELGLSGLVNAAGGLLLVALGALVFTLRPARPATRWFGVFAVCFGAGFLPDNLASVGDPYYVPAFALATALFLAAAAALVPLLRLVPRPLGPEERGAGRAALAFAGVLILLAAAQTVFTYEAVTDLFLGPGADPAVTAVLAAMLTSLAVLQGSLSGALLLLALRYRIAEQAKHGSGRAFAVLSAGLAAYPAFAMGNLLRLPEGHQSVPLYAELSVLALVVGIGPVVGVWLANASLGQGKLPRWLAWGILGVALAGSLVPLDNPGFGLSRAVCVVALGYAILRHHVLGLDLKVRWTIRQSTVAAAFIGVFFVASEGAQAFFGDAAGNQWLGIAAAGLLVFAMAPLQRAAERVASAAVPGASAPAPGSQREEAFKAALRLALRDRAVTRREERELALLADELRIGSQRTLALRDEVEDELARDAGARPR